jgi:hypothetical protein
MNFLVFALLAQPKRVGQKRAILAFNPKVLLDDPRPEVGIGCNPQSSGSPGLFDALDKRELVHALGNAQRAAVPGALQGFPNRSPQTAVINRLRVWDRVRCDCPGLRQRFRDGRKPADYPTLNTSRFFDNMGNSGSVKLTLRWSRQSAR